MIHLLKCYLKKLSLKTLGKYVTCTFLYDNTFCFIAIFILNIGMTDNLGTLFLKENIEINFIHLSTCQSVGNPVTETCEPQCLKTHYLLTLDKNVNLGRINIDD